ncbi:MAG: DNA repair protein RadA [Candidatus Babeliales bacterium]
MAKQTIKFYCTNCDYRPPKWIGCCSECNEWGSITELQPTLSSKVGSTSGALALTNLQEVSPLTHTRILSHIGEWDRVMGGGIVPGSLLILTGDPGIGKSTLLLQVVHQLAQDHHVLYFSSEESLEQVRGRAQRLNCLNNNILFSDQANLGSIIATCEQQKPTLIVVDSIQNCFSGDTHTIPGSVGQLRESAFHLMRLAKEHNIATILTGHITKEGHIAGPKMLEHMVDGVFYLQGEDQYHIRILRSVKNRFGPIHELGFFQMEEQGLQEVPNINQILLEQATFAPGSVLTSTLEGSRPLMLELQALTVPSKFGIPQRVISGIDHKQVVLIAAILEKYLRIKLSEQDIFFKVSGGFKIKESAADLAIAMALLSSYYQKPLAHKSLVLGEMSLTGDIKPTNRMQLHMNEAEKFGIETLFTAKAKGMKSSVKLRQFSSVYELLELFSE